ncbi:uncharacterized protein isoform X3 [Musca autumnalis]|uniref:uncharacterized protein isoform X3 n=1 Tax=Musca autumnalis TaxID=221902 RepID=UPI003CE6FD3B
MDYTKVCRLCVNTFEEGKPLYDENGQANIRHEITCKYFHPQIANMFEARYLSSICSQCWRTISEFHSFEAAVQLAQLKLLDLVTPKLENEAIINIYEAKFLSNMCSQCWQKISEFHSFETDIQLAQLKLMDIVTPPKPEKDSMRDDQQSVEDISRCGATVQDQMNITTKENITQLKDSSRETMSTTVNEIAQSSSSAMDIPDDNLPSVVEVDGLMIHIEESQFTTTIVQSSNDNEGSQPKTLGHLPQQPQTAAAAGTSTSSGATPTTQPSREKETQIYTIDPHSSGENQLYRKRKTNDSLVRPYERRYTSVLFHCLLCGQKIIKYDDKCKHYLEKHSNGQPLPSIIDNKIPCSLCDYTSGNIISYFNHYWIVHKNVKPVYNCTVCCQLYSKNRHLCPGPPKKLQAKSSTSSSSSNTNYVFFHCSECDRILQSEREIIEHIAAKHRKIDLYTCPSCEKTFDAVTKIPKHRKKHHPSEDKEEYYKHMDDKFDELLKEYLEKCENAPW